jgi:uncharacterized repeat protein (TIGR02543 family)
MKTGKLKRRLALFTALIMTLTLWTAVPLQASADETNTAVTAVTSSTGSQVTTDSAGFVYSIGVQSAFSSAIPNASIIGYTGAGTDLTMPSFITVDGIEHSVTSIGGGADATYTTRTAVTLPEGFTSIGRSAFSGCTSLTTITLPDTVTSIDNEAFYNCTSLSSLSNDTLPVSVTLKGNNIFGTGDLVTSISALGDYRYTITDGEATLWRYTGSSNTPSIPSTINSYPVTELGVGLFNGNTSLATIEIPASVTSLRGITGNNFSLTAINVNAANDRYWSSDGVLFGLDDVEWLAEDGAHIVPNVPTLITYPRGKTDQVYAIPASVSGRPAVKMITGFGSNTSLTKVTIPNTVTDIRSGAFSYCGSLTEITIPESVTTINQNAFTYTGLVSVTIPSGVKDIKNFLFSGCQSLTSVTMSGATSIGQQVFWNCPLLSSVTIPDSVTSIGSLTFQNTALTSVTIPAGVTSIGSSAFARNTALTSVVIENNSIGTYQFNGCTALTSVEIKGTITTISNSAFMNTGLTSVTLPASVTSVDANAFRDCTALASVAIQGAATIGEHAFDGCKALTSVAMPNVKSLANQAFQNTGLTSVTIPPSVTSLGSSVFAGNTALASVTIANTTIARYMFNGCTALTSVTISGAVTDIGDSAFMNTGLTSINIPASVTTIDANAFRDCIALEAATINGEATIGASAFRGDAKLASVTMPSVKSIGGSAFLEAGLTSVTIPSSVTSIGSSAFDGNASLASVTIQGAASIGANAFQNCTALTTVAISGTTSIAETAFSGCTSLTSIDVDGANTAYQDIDGVLFNKAEGSGAATRIIRYPSGKSNTYTVPDSVQYINASSFSGSTALTSVTLPSSVQYINGNSFNGCTSLEDVVILRTDNKMGSPSATAFANCDLDNLTLWCYTVNQVVSKYAGDNGINYGLLLADLTVDSTLSLVEGASQTLNAPGYLPSDTKTEKPAVTWSSSSESVATVDANGKVTAKTAGSTDITVSAESKSGQTITSGNCVVTVSAAPAGSITSFTLKDADQNTYTGDINGNAISVTVPYSTNVAALTPTISFNGSAVAPASEVVQNFTNPVPYQVDSGTVYTVTVTRAVAPKDITAFTLASVPGEITDTSAADGIITVTVPAGTDITSLMPVITHTGASISPTTAKNFTEEVIYTVTGADSAKKYYTVTVTVIPSTEKDIDSFTLADVEGVIDGSVITVTLPYGTPVTALTPLIEASEGAAVTPAGSQSFSSNVKYTVTAEDGSKKVYTVVVRFTPASTEREITRFTLLGENADISGTDITVEFPYGTDVTELEPEIEISDLASVSPASGEAKNFTNPVTYAVTAQSGARQTYTVTVTFSPVITEFKIGSATGTIDQEAETIAVTVPYGTNVAGVTPTITHNSTAANPIAPVGAQNFGSPVDYTVTAASGSYKTYRVTVTVAPQPPVSTYALTVIGGTDNTNAGPYEEGAEVSITAGEPADGKVFDKWTSSAGGSFTDATKESTIFTMPDHAVTVTATYKDDPNAGEPDDPDNPNPPDNPPATDSDWVYEDGTWKYLVGGEVATGWIRDDGAWYYLAATGVMETGWVYDGGTWYYLSGNGAMKTGWLKDGGSWYYLAGNGAMVAGKWFKDTDGSWYYLSGNGKMLTGKQKIGGKVYSFKSNGVWIG